MANTNANSWDAAKIINGMTPEQLQGLRVQLESEKALSIIKGRKYNQQLLGFVERRIEGGLCDA